MAKKAAKRKENSLRLQAIAESSLHSKSRITWFQKLEKDYPEECAELRQLITDWRSGDKELRAAYPSARALGRFVESLPFITIRENAILALISGKTI